MKDYDYVTIYLPYDSPTQRSRDSALISQEATDWLNDQVGKGCHGFREWLLAHDNLEMSWCYAGIDYLPPEGVKLGRKFYFRDIQKATLFKLTWG